MKTKAKKTVASTVVQTSTATVTTPVVSEPKPYAVLADKQGVGYLRVAFTKLGAQVILNTGKEVALVSLDAKTIKSRALAPVPGMDTAEEVLKSARLLAHPLTANIKVQPSAQKVLNSILEDKELIEMASKKKAEKKAPKVKAAVKAAGNGRGRVVVDLATVKVKLLKFPAEADKIRGNQLAVLETLKENGKNMTVAELVSKLRTPTKNKNGQLAVWKHNRPILEAKGFISVAA
jgi:hypothetical protein